MTRVLEHAAEVQAARDLAVGILEEDPELRAYQHRELEKGDEGPFPGGRSRCRSIGLMRAVTGAE